MPQQNNKLFVIISVIGINILIILLLLANLESTQAVEAPPSDNLAFSDLHDSDNPPDAFGGGSFETGADDLPDAQRTAIEARLQQNVRALGLDEVSRVDGATAVSFIFPVQAADHFTDYGFHTTTNFVDHASGSTIRDYQCGEKTYDGHRGTDYILWPFAWNKMDNEDVQVIAAADGLIIDKEDGNQDRSCNWVNAPPWNAVYLQHADGSVTWYGHLKQNSLLSKTIGSSVSAGEYLGLVGSSGASTVPHLHFEVWQDNSYTQQRDPYAGTCNALNANSWWQTQRPYYDSAINKLTTGNAAVEFQDCSQHDISNEKTSFAPGDRIYFTTYYRDQLNSQTSQYTIYRPDGSIYQRWNHVGNKPHYELSYWWWAYTMPPNAPLGTWKFVVAYESQSYETSFTISPPVYITITNPTGASEWLPGETHTITWQSTYSNNVKIDLYKGNLYSTTLTNTTPYETGFAWTIPLSPTLAPDYQIRVTDVVTPTIFGDSMYFSIGDLDKAYLPTILKE